MRTFPRAYGGNFVTKRLPREHDDVTKGSWVTPAAWGQRVYFLLGRSAGQSRDNRWPRVAV